MVNKEKMVKYYFSIFLETLKNVRTADILVNIPSGM
jgi:hypothetical protein